jgi:hypothetical protein
MNIEQWWDNNVITKNNHYIKLLGMFLKGGKEALNVIKCIILQVIGRYRSNCHKPAPDLFKNTLYRFI